MGVMEPKELAGKKESKEIGEGKGNRERLVLVDKQGKRETRDSMAVLETPESKETVVKVVCVGPLDPLVYPDKMVAKVLLDHLGTLVVLDFPAPLDQLVSQAATETMERRAKREIVDSKAPLDLLDTAKDAQCKEDRSTLERSLTSTPNMGPCRGLLNHVGTWLSITIKLVRTRSTTLIQMVVLAPMPLLFIVCQSQMMKGLRNTTHAYSHPMIQIQWKSSVTAIRC